MRVVDNFCGKLNICGKVALFQRFLIVDYLTDKKSFANQKVYIITSKVMGVHDKKRKNFGIEV